MNLDTITPEEIVDGFMIPSQISIKEKHQADLELNNIRKQRSADRSDQGKLYGQLLQLKILIEDYVNQDNLDPEKDFAYFLKSYIDIQHKRKNDIAYELDIHKSKLSQLLSGNRAPSEDIFVRLEFHSNRFISARNWLRLSIKQQEYSIMTNSSMRNEQKKHLKGHLKFEFQ